MELARRRCEYAKLRVFTTMRAASKDDADAPSDEERLVTEVLARASCRVSCRASLSRCSSAESHKRASAAEQVDLDLDAAVSAVAISGWLLKRGGGDGAAFKRRWCVLRGCKLLWHSDAESDTPSGWLDLRGAKVTQAVATKGKACVRVSLKEGTARHRYVLQLADASEHAAWLEALTAVVMSSDGEEEEEAEGGAGGSSGGAVSGGGRGAIRASLVEDGDSDGDDEPLENGAALSEYAARYRNAAAASEERQQAELSALLGVASPLSLKARRELQRAVDDAEAKRQQRQQPGGGGGGSGGGGGGGPLGEASVQSTAARRGSSNPPLSKQGSSKDQHQLLAEVSTTPQAMTD